MRAGEPLAKMQGQRMYADVVTLLWHADQHYAALRLGEPIAGLDHCRQTRVVDEAVHSLGAGNGGNGLGSVLARAVDEVGCAISSARCSLASWRSTAMIG